MNLSLKYFPEHINNEQIFFFSYRGLISRQIYLLVFSFVSVPITCFQGASGFTISGELYPTYVNRGPTFRCFKALIIYSFIYFQPFIHLLADYFPNQEL